MKYLRKFCSIAGFETIYEKIPSLFHALFGILIFYLPIQYRYHGIIKRFLKRFGCSLISQELNSVLGFYLTDFLMIGLCLLCATKWKNSIRKNKALVFFIAISFFSVVASKNRFLFWPYVSWMQLVVPIVLYLVLSAEEKSRKIVKVFCWIIFVSSLFESAIAIGQYSLQKEVGLRSLGEPVLHCNGSPNFLMPEKNRWIFDTLFHITAPSQAILRVSGTLPHPNILGGFLGVAILITSWLFLENKRGRIFLAGALLAQILALFLTYSRAALFGWMIITIVLFWVGRRFYSILSLFFVLGISILLSLVILHKQLLQRGGVVNYTETVKASDFHRVEYQKMAVKMAKNRPCLGVGWNQFLQHAQEVAPFTVPENFQFLTVHSIYFLLLAETGILGLGCFLVFACSLLIQIWRQGINRDTALLFIIWTFLLLIGSCDHYLLTCQQGRMLFFISAALLASQRAKQNQAHVIRQEQLEKGKADWSSC